MCVEAGLDLTIALKRQPPIHVIAPNIFDTGPGWFSPQCVAECLSQSSGTHSSCLLLVPGLCDLIHIQDPIDECSPPTTPSGQCRCRSAYGVQKNKAALFPIESVDVLDVAPCAELEVGEAPTSNEILGR